MIGLRLVFNCIDAMNDWDRQTNIRYDTIRQCVFNVQEKADG